MINFILGILASLIAALIGYIIKKVLNFVQNKSELCGKWYSAIYDDRGNVIKNDVIYLIHNRKTGKIKGRMIREFPHLQRHRKWSFTGEMRGSILVACVVSQETVNSICSGCFKLIDDYLFSGFYLRWDDAKGKIIQVKIEMKKELK